MARRCSIHPGWEAQSCVWCGHKGDGVFSTPKDKRYEFVTTHVKPGTEIRTKGQWEHFLRKNNLTADLSVKEKMDMVSRGYAQKKRIERSQQLRQELRPVFERAYREVRG